MNSASHIAYKISKANDNILLGKSSVLRNFDIVEVYEEFKTRLRIVLTYLMCKAVDEIKTVSAVAFLFNLLFALITLAEEIGAVIAD